ncbi:MAG: F0F1 ATP synthase subunit delta [bacterium]|nr:F0F1 ATP synthase subunit delta [bacterium]
MRYSPALYAKSLFEVLDGAKSDEYDLILQNFKQTIEKYGDLSRINSIIEFFEGLVVTSSGGRMIEIETAREIPDAEQSQLAKLFKQGDIIKKSIDPSLVAGVRVEIDGEVELDYSLARKFRNMFAVK